VNRHTAELYALWEGNEYHEVEIRYESSWYGNPAWWHVNLLWHSEYDNPHQAEWVTYTWQFYDRQLSAALADALDFAKALVALAPEEEE